MEADPLTTTWEAAEEFNVNHSRVAQHLKQIEKVKHLSKSILQELISYHKYHHSEALSSYSMQQQWTVSLYDCDVWWESGFYTTTSSNQLRGWTNEKLQSTSQSQACIKKRVMVTFGGLLPFWLTTAFWILAKPLHLRSVLSKSVRCTKNGNTCSWHRSTERAQFFFLTLPTDCTLILIYCFPSHSTVLGPDPK